MRVSVYTVGMLLLTGLLFHACEEAPPTVSRIRISLQATDASSYGAEDGAITAEVEGGTPPYHYFWSHGATSPSVQGLPAGAYTLKVVDSYSGVASQAVQVRQPDATPLAIVFDTTSVSWYGGNDGSVAVSVSGGTPPYAYAWANGEEEPVLGGLMAGTYVITVTDAGDPAIVTVDSVELLQPTFVCGRDSITDVDGNKYPTVQIGEQCWLRENLRTRHLPEDPLTGIDGHFCDGTNCNNALGAHYTWDAAMNGAPSASGDEEVQGICPCDWHLPTREEWTAFNAYLSINGNGGTGTNVPNKIRGAGSPSGFDALYAGNWGYAAFQGENAVFWTATEQNDERAFYRILNNFPLLGQGNLDKRSGLSVRCLRNR